MQSRKTGRPLGRTLSGTELNRPSGWQAKLPPSQQAAPVDPLPPPLPLPAPLSIQRTTPARPAFVRQRKFTGRKRFLLSNAPLQPPGAPGLMPAPLPLSPEQLKADRAVQHPFGYGRSTKGAVYTGWGSDVLGRGLSAVAGSAEAVAAMGIFGALGALFDANNIDKERTNDQHDYVTGLLMLLHQQSCLQRAQQGGAPLDPDTQELLAFNIRTLTQMMENFEQAYYPRDQLPYLKRIRQRTRDEAQALGRCFAQIDALAERCHGLQADKASLQQTVAELTLQLQPLARSADEPSSKASRRLRQRRDRATEQLHAIDEELLAAANHLDGLKHTAKQRLDKVLRLVSRPHLKKAAQRERDRVRQQRQDLQALLDRHRQRAQRLTVLGDGEGSGRDGCLSALDADIQRLKQRVPAWDRAIATWSDRSHRPPEPRDLAAIVRRLLACLDAREKALDAEIEAFSTHRWASLFSPYKGMAPKAIKRFRDVNIQLPKAALDTTSSLLSIVQLFTHMVLNTVGGPALTLLSCLFSLYYARGDNKDARHELASNRANKQRKLQEACRVSEVLAACKALPPSPERAVAGAVGHTLLICRQRQLKLLHRATKQAEIRSAKGELSYVAVAVAVIGNIATLSSLGFASPLFSLPAAVVSGTYLISVGENILEARFDAEHAKLRESIALAFVARFGIAGAMGLYAAFDGADEAGLRQWGLDLKQFGAEWQQRLQRDHDPIPQGFSPAFERLLLPVSVYFNEFLAIEVCVDQLSRQACDAPSSPGFVEQLLADLGMSADILKLLRKNLGAYRTADHHRTAVRQFVVAFYDTRLYPGHRLPAHVLQRPRTVARQVEDWLREARSALPQAQDEALHLLLGRMHQQPGEGLRLIKRTDAGVRQALGTVLSSVHPRLSRAFIGPADLIGLQAQLMVGQPGDALEHTGVLRGEADPVWLELLANPSYWVKEASLKRTLEPVPPGGAASLSRLIAAMKTVGDRRRRRKAGSHQPVPREGATDLDERMGRPIGPGAAAPGATRLAPRVPEPAQPVAPSIEAALDQAIQGLDPNTLHTSSEEGPPPQAWAQRKPFWRRSIDEATLRRRRLMSRLRKTLPNPLATPARALDRLQNMTPGNAVLAGQILREWALHEDPPPAQAADAPQAMTDIEALVNHLRSRLAAAALTAKHTQRAVQDRPQHRWPDGTVLGANKNEWLRQRMQTIRELCDVLMAYLDNPATRAQLQALPH